jgi:hypothetical protein
MKAGVSLVWLAVAIVVAAVLWIGLTAAFLPCTLDCGETYEAHIGALNLDRFGLRYAAGLQDFAAGAAPSAHPTLYTHNPNLAMYFMYALFRLGVRDVHAQAACAAAPFGIGLAYLYLFLRAVTRDRLFAALALLTAATSYLLVLLWAFSPLRGLSWLLTFGPLHHLVRYGRRRRRLDLVVALVLVGLSFGMDYPFAVFVAASILALGWLGLTPLPLRTLLAVVGIGLGVPLVLRQLQVIAAVGAEFWTLDVFASLARRIPLVGLAWTPPDPATLERLYTQHGIVKWPGEGQFAPARWVARTLRAYFTVLGVPLVVAAALWLAGLVAARRRGIRAVVRRFGRPAAAAGGVALALGSGLVVTFVLFGEYFAAFYGILLMPAVVHWIVVVLALTAWLLVTHRRAGATIAGRSVPIGALALAAFVAWRGATEVRNAWTLPPRPYPGRAALEEIAGHGAVTFWISSAVSTYTGTWAATLNDPRWRTLTRADLPFDPDRDYYFFMEADRSDPRYRMPDFLFVPALNVPWLDDRVCRPLRGYVMTFADGCSDLEIMARRLAWLPLHRRGDDFLLYDLRGLYRGSGATQ